MDFLENLLHLNNHYIFFTYIAPRHLFNAKKNQCPTFSSCWRGSGYEGIHDGVGADKASDAAARHMVTERARIFDIISELTLI
ncbi:hypothetical protein Y032_0446g1594 [Ancylostoma ceylanicum]|uniref:Uncharacterized protein n=1 Tax=Ancylostoma ceylanicum TaxID=53326 RepID=A0A016WYZ3_9BILA|nr:hypothetical protein Y032_0446g1594 [Ancylostoma ceylanicum]